MKKPIVLSFYFIMVDQVIKLLIAHFFINEDIVLLPNILFFRPVQNTNLMWIASIIDFKTPILLMIGIQTFSLATIIFSYRYLLYLWNQGKKFLNGMLLFFTAGLLCSFIDVVFWGGSLDFLRLSDWFTFDLKDIYLNIASGFLLLYAGSYFLKKYRKMDKEERRQTGLWLWIKKGMPSSSSE